VVSQAGATWGTAQAVPGTATGGIFQVTSLSCASAGPCSAGGSYKDGSSHFQAFVVNKA
jgi:hypothetical protein